MANILSHHGDDESKVSSDLRCYRWCDYRSALSITTQVWSWEGGEAIVFVYGPVGDSHTVVVLRVGDRFHTVQDVGLKVAMEAYGFEGPYEIQAAA